MSVSQKKALRRAAGLAIAYALVAATYIFLSTNLAVRFAPDIDDLSRIETVKGIFFVLVTSLVLLGGSYWLLSRAAKDADELRRSREALLLSEQRALAGLLASSVAHDVGNLLVPLHAGVRDLRDELGASASPSVRELLDEMTEAVDRLVEVSRRQMTMGREGAGRFSEIDLAEVVHEATQIARRHTKVRGMTIDVIGPDHVDAHANATLLQQVILNLIVNAAEATGGNGRVEVRYGESGSDLFLEVSDDGPGFENKERAFEPFFTTKRGGTGLGLFSVRACAGLHGGAVELGSVPLGGASVRLSFPRPPRAEAA